MKFTFRGTAQRTLSIRVVLIVRTAWPSGLRRYVQVVVREGVGSNPTAVTFSMKWYRGRVGNRSIIYVTCKCENPLGQKFIGLRPRKFESCPCCIKRGTIQCTVSLYAHYSIVQGLSQKLVRDCGVVVSHPLLMRSVPGSNPGDCIHFADQKCAFVARDYDELHQAATEDAIWSWRVSIPLPLAC